MAAKAPGSQEPAFKGDFYCGKKARPACVWSSSLIRSLASESAGIPNLKFLFCTVLVIYLAREGKFGQSDPTWSPNFFFFFSLLPPDPTLQHAGGVMDRCGCRRESTAATGGSPRRDRTSAGVRAEPLGTCAPDRYRAAKFSLAAYLLCWLVLRWYQVRALLAAAEHF